MAITSPSDVFLYELSGVYDAEKRAADWKSEVAGRIRDNKLQQVVRVEQQEGQQRVKNVEACFQALGTRPRDVSSSTVEGALAELRQFMNQQPSPEAIEMYAVDSLLKMSHLGIGSYKGLVDKAMTMSQPQCAQLLQNNLVIKEEDAGRMERISHEMNQRIMATA